jgi:hypothetical protein
MLRVIDKQAQLVEDENLTFQRDLCINNQPLKTTQQIDL